MQNYLRKVFLLRKTIFKILLLIVLLVFLLSGCSTSKVIGYTYDLDEHNNQIKLDDIYSFSYEIKDDEIIGEIQIKDNSSEFKGILVDHNEDQQKFHGNINFKEDEKEFDISIYNGETATGLYYNKSRKNVNGFVIERITEQ